MEQVPNKFKKLTIIIPPNDVGLTIVCPGVKSRKVSSFKTPVSSMSNCVIGMPTENNPECSNTVSVT